MGWDGGLDVPEATFARTLRLFTQRLAVVRGTLPRSSSLLVSVSCVGMGIGESAGGESRPVRGFGEFVPVRQTKAWSHKGAARTGYCRVRDRAISEETSRRSESEIQGIIVEERDPHRSHGAGRLRRHRG